MRAKKIIIEKKNKMFNGNYRPRMLERRLWHARERIRRAMLANQHLVRRSLTPVQLPRRLLQIGSKINWISEGDGSLYPATVVGWSKDHIKYVISFDDKKCRNVSYVYPHEVKPIGNAVYIGTKHYPELAGKVHKIIMLFDSPAQLYCLSLCLLLMHGLITFNRRYHYAPLML